MTVSMFEPMNGQSMTRVHPVALPRAQVGIERLPARRIGNEPRESMNCKSCRKRKIKCNRLRPACEACSVFQCPCVYDAVPKKRGPKTDVLEALLKRVDGLEAKLKEKNSAESPTTPTIPGMEDDGAAKASQEGERNSKRLAIDTKSLGDGNETAIFSPETASETSPSVQTDSLLDIYFTRLHAKPYHVLDESSVRQRLQLNQLPDCLVHAIYAVAARFTPHPHGYQAAVKLSEDYAAQARGEADVDEPSVDTLQTLILLVLAFMAAGKGKKAYMLMTAAVGMAMALEMHREMDAHASITPVEREVRRRLFWTCYLLDRLLACGSKRPSLIADKEILLRLPCWSPNQASLPMEGEFFRAGSNLQYLQGSGKKKSQGGSGMLIDIVRILGVTNRYLAAGGVKGDPCFPWHMASKLSKIRQELDTWASGTDDIFTSPEALFGQADSTVLVLSKLTYHLIHCLIYRPFLPVDLSELTTGNGQHQSWQIEATNMCFYHANAIAELVDMGKQAGSVEWPAFVGYAICTAGTVHIHGAHYARAGNSSGSSSGGGGAGAETSFFSQSADFLSHEMQQLAELRFAWASVQHHSNILQGLYNAHAELVKTVGFSPGFQLEDFFDRYYSSLGGGANFAIDAANLTLQDITVAFTANDAFPGPDIHGYGMGGGSGQHQHQHHHHHHHHQQQMTRGSLKRKNTLTSDRARPSLSALTGTAVSPLVNGPQSAGGLPRIHHRTSFSGMPPPPSPLIATPSSLPDPHMSGMDLGGDDVAGNVAAAAAAAVAARFSIPPPHTPAFGAQQQQHQQFSYAGSGGNENNTQVNMGGGGGGGGSGYDPMFGGMAGSAFASPAPTNFGDDEQQQRRGGSQLKPPEGSGSVVCGNGNAKQDNGGVVVVRNGDEMMGSSPGDAGTVGAGPPAGEEKDPFLSMLEQLAESEGRAAGSTDDAHGRAGSEFDFFFTGNGGGGLT